MKIVVAVRCYNEVKNIERFMRGYDFADEIVVSDGGSTDGSLELLNKYPKITLLHFEQQETINGQTWNPDAPHMNYVLNWAKTLEPDWLIFDDMDDVPNIMLREGARDIFENAFILQYSQINAFRLYMWGDDQYFPYMNRNFDEQYRSLWAWNPKKIDIFADMSIKHGTLLGFADNSNIMKLVTPYVLLHKSWNPETIQAKVKRYNKLGLPMNHPLEFAGEPQPLPDWAVE